MKASVFIKTALIDQMQQIADLGLWFHLAKLIPSGVEVLARVRYAGPSIPEGNIFPPMEVKSVVEGFYREYAPEYVGKYPHSKDFFSINPTCYLVSDQQGAENHLNNSQDGKRVVYVPQWFEDFKSWCGIVLEKIEAGEIKDIEVLKTSEE